MIWMVVCTVINYSVGNRLFTLRMTCTATSAFHTSENVCAPIFTAHVYLYLSFSLSIFFVFYTIWEMAIIPSTRKTVMWKIVFASFGRDREKWEEKKNLQWNNIEENLKYLFLSLSAFQSITTLYSIVEVYVGWHDFKVISDQLKAIALIIGWLVMFSYYLCPFFQSLQFNN